MYVDKRESEGCSNAFGLTWRHEGLSAIVCWNVRPQPCPDPSRGPTDDEIAGAIQAARQERAAWRAQSWGSSLSFRH